MKVLDMFSGLGGFSQAFKDRGHDVVTIDIEKKFNPTICTDIMKITPKELIEGYGEFDIVLASPPCNCFSVASEYRHWDKKTKKPKDQQTREAIKLIGHTINMIMNLQPRFWILENPRGMLRNVLGKPTVTTFFASWGHWALKPTDLWGVHPEIDWKKPKKWEKAPRGSKTGVQGINGNKYQKAYPENMSMKVRKPELRALIPYELSMAICIACEKELNRELLMKGN